MNGRNVLVLGNATETGAEGNQNGAIRFYSKGKGYINLEATQSDTNYTATFPAASGTVAYTNHNHKMAKCTTAATTAAKVATLDGFKLETDCVISIYFSAATGPIASPTLNVNSTGAKPLHIMYNGSSSVGSATRYLPLGAYQAWYNGTNWILFAGRTDLKTS